MDTADITEGVFSDFGESAVLLGDQWRATVEIVFTPAWAAAVAGGIGIEREEPTAQIRTSDADEYDIETGWKFEIGSGSAAVVYRVTSRADDGLGISLLTLAREP
jgi:hypothetical protein